MDTIMPLSKRKYETCKCPSDKPMIVFFDERGLSLRVTRTQKKSWIYQYTFDKKRTNMTLGSYPELSLAAARDE